MIDAEAIARTVQSCPSVADMSPGSLGEVATYLPGRRVVGVRVLPDRIEVHVVARWGTSLPMVGREISSAIRPLVADLPVDVYIEDIDMSGSVERESSPVKG